MLCKNFNNKQWASSDSNSLKSISLNPIQELDPDERAKLLQTTDLFATAHAQAASGGQSSMPENLNTNEHFVAFVQAPNPLEPGKKRLVELDGRRPAPLDLGDSTDLLKVFDLSRIVQI